MALSASDHVAVSDKEDISARTTQPLYSFNHSNEVHHLHRPQLPTVEDALQYSPLSSIVPFSPDIIPFPNSHLSNAQPIFPTLAEQHVANQQLEILDKDLVNNQGQYLAQNTLKDLLPYFNPRTITNFKFKAPTRIIAGKSGIQPSLNNQRHHPEGTTGACAFANMVLKATDIACRYPTPCSPEFGSPKSEVLPKTAKQAPIIQSRAVAQEQAATSATHEQYIHNQGAFSRNARDVGFFVEIPPSSAKIITKVNQTSNKNSETPRQHKRPEVASRTTDQSAVADEALHRLQEIIQDIFEVNDQSQHDTPSAISPADHFKLDAALQKVISLGRYDQVPVEHVSRLESLCLGGLEATEASGFQIKSSSGAEDNGNWVQEMEALDSGLRSTRTILRIMTGGRQEKEIYSEELLQNVLGVIQKIIDSVIIPVVEARSTESSSVLFETASSHQKLLVQLLNDAKKALDLLGNLLEAVELAETLITTVEFFAIRLLFVDNAPTEKEAILGIQRFETLRRTAMDLITEIYSRYPQQRAFLLDEVLSSVQKLPVKGQQARQYKLSDGTSIQLVSALIIRLVQTTATLTAAQRGNIQEITSDAMEGDSSDGSEVEAADTITGKRMGNAQEYAPDSAEEVAMRRLTKSASTLSNSALKDAHCVIRFYVSRASTTPKTGDQPHRQLLDMFVDDLIAVLGFPEWPAAELLLRVLLFHMVQISEDKNSSAPAKTMALEFLGRMGSAISELVANTRIWARNLENHDSDCSGHLRKLLDDYVEAKMEMSELLGWQGPYHTVVEYLRSAGSEDKHIMTARGYYLTQWVNAVSYGNLPAGPAIDRIVGRLQKMLGTAERNSPEIGMEPVSNNQIRLAYALTILNMSFCRQFDRILRILLDSIGSESTTVRNRSLKSVMQMLEKDPSLLVRAENVKVKIMSCTTDKSPMVRDSALMLIGKCILLQPTLEQELCVAVLKLMNDDSIGVRKRSMRLLKETYLRNSRKDIKSAISDSLLNRTKDPDAGVSELARQILEDIWFAPFWKYADSTEHSVQDKISMQSQVGLIVGTVQRGEDFSLAIVSLIQTVISDDSKMAAANFKVCKALVGIAFEGMVYSQDLPECLEQRHILQTLTVFARSDPRLFAADQLQYLQPYVTSLSSSDDLALFGSVVSIFRCVLPILSTIQHGLLRDVQKALLHSISKLGKKELDEVAACLWSINGTLNEPEKLIKLIISVLKGLNELEKQKINFADPQRNDSLTRVKKYVRIAGHFGKHCDFEKYSRNFRDYLPWWNGSSVAGLIVGSLSPFANAKQPMSLRFDALEGIGLICQSWPLLYSQEIISGLFGEVFQEDSPDLQNIALSSFRNFFSGQERQAGIKNVEVSGKENPHVNGKLGGSIIPSDGDGASALIAERFFKTICRIALATQDLSALTATQVITSINRQGLVHPGETCRALVALETSDNEDIAEVAFQEHRNLHQQHESLYGREYMEAIREAFVYQKDVVKNPSGTTRQPLGSKLHRMFEIIKTSKGNYQKKFFSNFCSTVDFDIAKLDTPSAMAKTLEYSRFLVENLAFFKYERAEELVHTISCMEKIFANTGAGIAHTISSEGIQVQDGPGLPNGERLRQLTTGSIILSCLWEVRSYLVRRLYDLQVGQPSRDTKIKALVKDLSKTPNGVQEVSGERLLATIAEKVNSLESQEAMLGQCREFCELMATDSEARGAANGEDESGAHDTPSGDEVDRSILLTPKVGAKTLKRKSSVSVAGTPHKRKATRPSLGKVAKRNK